eukprot:TRINITY_DN472_c0_g2_i1.p1 TRINITY_DN472_c0_g2~~TRINITY_DN472_c0_g2_i1.p1  ORF type:complete len:124 (-),score=11.54 TRINITY_DN472_c0_g2_i1:559-930(-)
MQKQWDTVSLLVIDVQNEFWLSEKTQLPKYFTKFATNMQNLIEFCRQVEIEVIHVKEEFTSDRTTWLPSHVLRGYALCMKGTRAAEIVPFATPKSGEKVFTKTTYDPFYSTGLKDYLLTRGKK